MAKKKRKKTKTIRAAAKGKAAKKKTVGKKTSKKTAAKRAVAKKRPKVAIGKKSKPAAAKPKAPPATGPAATTVAPPRETLSHKIASAVGSVLDVFTDAERLHHRLEPDISNEPE